MVRVGKQLPPGTFVVYVGTRIMDVVYSRSRQQAFEWAQRAYGRYVRRLEQEAAA